jgi:hypothetical protein
MAVVAVDSSAPDAAGDGEPPSVAPFTGVRTTTGGIGREPGMLIFTRVVSVVSVLGSSGALSPVGGAGGC